MNDQGMRRRRCREGRCCAHGSPARHAKFVRVTIWRERAPERGVIAPIGPPPKVEILIDGQTFHAEGVEFLDRVR